MIVSQLMSRNLVTCRAQDSLEGVAGKMWEEDIGCLPVVDDDGRVVGMITDRDVCMAAYTQGRPLGSIPVRLAMADHVFSCGPTDRIRAAEEVMKAHQVRRLPVIDEKDRLVGLLAMNDIVREAAREFGKKRPDVGSTELVTTLATICEPRNRGPLAVAAQ